MEASNELISSRKSKLNSQITGKFIASEKLKLLHRESLLDAFQALYDECSIEALQKYDKQIAVFVEKFKTTIQTMKKLRINISDFEIKNVIGRGHFGDVHVVKEKQTGDIYAMKTIRKSESVEKTSFDTERDIMAFSHSPWLTSLQYAFQDNYYLYFVMEFHPGGDLLGLLYRQGGTLPESAAVFYIAELVLALDELHGMGFVHRDIKPDNVLLDRCGHLKLVDFGSAAKLNQKGLVMKGPPVGTPDYVAPEVLQAAEDKKSQGYGVSCDYWSLGILAYELTVGKPPFSAQNTTVTYSKIMNHTNNLKFPSDVLLTQAYTSFVKKLVTEEKCRLKKDQIKSQPLFKNIHFDSLRDQVPPYVPKISSLEDTSNFTDVAPKKSVPSIENFKRKTQFSGRNLPFVGFTFVHDFDESGQRKSFGNRRSESVKDEVIRSLRGELEGAKRGLMDLEDFKLEKLGLERKVMEKAQKLENIESVRDKLERDLATTIAECTALKRTLEIERKDRSELERKALELIKSAKTKWETSERARIESMRLEIEQQQTKIAELTTTNKLLNEQLQCAFKIEEKNRESLGVVEKLSRRSVIGLESRLEKVSVEMKNTVSDLQADLQETSHEKRVLLSKLEKSRENEKRMLEELSVTKKNYVSLKENVEDAEKIIRQLSLKVGELEEEMQKSEELKEEISQLSHDLNSSNVKIKELEKRNLLLLNEHKSLDNDTKQEINELKKVKQEQEKTLTELESKLQQEQEKHETFKKQLEQDLESLKTKNKNTEDDDSQELKDLRMKFWRMEKEFGNCKIDKRILERELKDAQIEIKDLKEEINKQSKASVEARKIHEKSLLELSGMNESLSMEVMKLKEGQRSLREILDNEREKCDNEKSVIVELKEVIYGKDVKMEEVLKECSGLKAEVGTLLRRLDAAENEKNGLVAEKGELDKEVHRVKDELENVMRQMKNTQLNWEALKEACTLLENQVVEYENLNTAIKDEKLKLNENIEKLIKDLCAAKSDIQEAKKLANEEKSLRLLAESKCARLNEDLQCLENECSSYKNHCDQYKECSNRLSEELTVAEEKITDLEVNLKSYERQLEDAFCENNSLKEEISGVLTQLGGVREANFHLKQEVQELKSKIQIYAHKGEELERSLIAKSGFYAERELKYESTIKQQTKLIDYLQVKVDEHNNKKKTFTEKIFGHSKKENQSPMVMSLNYKDLEEQFQKQRNFNRELQEEVYRLKAQISGKENLDVYNKLTKVERHKSEIISPRGRLAAGKVAKSPIMGKCDLLRQNSQQTLHSFSTKLADKISKCFHCSSQISLGSSLVVCLECNISVHPHCKNFTKLPCSKLPQSNSVKEDFQEGQVEVEGWIKMLGKNDSWEKLYARLTDTRLNIYANSSRDAGILNESYKLKEPGQKLKIILEPLTSEIGANVVASDLPLVIKLEILHETTCWPATNIIFMTLSMSERDKWFKALQKFQFEDPAAAFNIETVCPSLPQDVAVNCVTDLTKNIRIFGTDRGIYSHHNGTLLQISGPNKIRQITIVPNTNIVVMIAGDSNILISCDLNHLINVSQCAPCTQPNLKHKTLSLDNMRDFHFLQASSPGRRHKMFCAANHRHLVLVKYDLNVNDFNVLRVMDTQEPVRCALFTEHTLIAGADKFFEIDLASCQAEEFLDSSDLSLSHAVKCCKRKSFPVNIEEIIDDPREYLVCFKEFAVFIDEYGRSSRKFDIKPNYLPRGFYYVRPYLYIMNSGGLEVFKLTPDCLVSGAGSTDESSVSLRSNCVDLKNVRYLGKAKGGIYVYHEGKVKLVEGRKIVDSDEISLSSLDTDQATEVNEDSIASASDRFSFTSSIVQSLDGHMSDVDSGSEVNLNSNGGRKVTFSQTNL